MQVEQEERVEYTFTIEGEDRQFTNTLYELLRSSNMMNELFLTRINELLQSKDLIEPKEISELALILSLSVLPMKQGSSFSGQSKQIQQSYTSVQQLQKAILQGKRPCKQKMECIQLMGWISKIWDKMLHFSCYKNHLDLIVLYYFVGEFLLYPEPQFKRLLNLLLQSVNKTKQFTEKSLEIILYLLMFFSNANEIKHFSLETKTKLKMITILYLTKLNDPTMSELNFLRDRLEEINENYLHVLMDQLQKVEESGNFHEEELIWDKLFTALLSSYSKYDCLKATILKLIVEMVSFKLDLQTMKLLIRELQITNEERPLKKWREIFQIMNIALKIYDTPKECLSFLSPKSFIKYPLQNSHSFYIQTEVKMSTRITRQQKMLFMLQDKQRTQQIWFVMRNHSECEAILMMLKIERGIITEKTKLEAKWKQYNSNLIAIEFANNQISIALQDQRIAMPTDKSANFTTFVIGDEDGNFGTSIKSVLSLSFYSNSKGDNGLCIKLEVGANKNTFKSIRKKTIPSFVQIMRMVGDLDIFLMIISHAIKKLKRNEDIVEMIREAINLLERFVEVKKVKQQKVNVIQRQKRLNAILCLCWQCSHQTFSALAVLELLRFLTIRGVSNPDDELQILCNFVFWKQFEWEYQKLIIMKIKELFSEMRIRENNHRHIKKYCQRILEQTALYYREEEYLTNGIQNKDNILRIHYEFITLVKEQLLYLLDDKKSIEDYYDFIEFTVKMLNWTLSRRSNIIQAFDMTFSVELSFFARELTQKLKEWLGKEEKLLKIVKGIIQVVGVYETEEPYYEDKKVRLYNDKGFASYDDKIIKQNLYFLAYSLIVFKPNILYSVIDSDEIGFSQINCVVWQKKIIQPIMMSMDKSQFYQLSSEQVSEIKYLFERLSLKSLSCDQNKMMLMIYLGNQKFYSEVDLRLSLHFCKIVSIKDLLQIINYSISSPKRGDQSNEQKLNKTFSTVSLRFDVKCDKIISLLGCCEELTFEEGFSVLEELNRLYNPKETKLNFMLQHFVLKGLVQRTLQIVENNQTSSQFVSSLTEIQSQINLTSSSSFSTAVVHQKLLLNRGLLIGCLEYYFKSITVDDLIFFIGIDSSQQAQCHLQNYRLNIECVMNSLGSTEVSHIYKLKNYYHFLEKQLLPLSKYYIESMNIRPLIEQKYTSQRMRKGSKQVLELPKYNFQQESKNMYISFLDERNLNLLKVEKVWLEVEERNKSFWSTFIGKEYDYCLYQGTGCNNERYLLKKDSKKPKLQLPKMLMKGSVQRSASIISQKFQFNNNDQSTSSIFDDAHLYRKQPLSCQNVSNLQEANKESFKNNKFRVLLITSSKIYQGIITILTGKMSFKENQEISSDLYQKIFASECEKRLEDQCIKENYVFEEELTPRCIAIVKRYLFHDIAVEIHTKNRSHLLIFNKKDHRNTFLFFIEKHMRVLNRDKLGEEVKVYSEKWQNGFISNYQYLMKLNDLTGRSFNDLSQYYIFPWTVANFEDPIDMKFFHNKGNFRDLSLPIGKLHKPKWEDIKEKFEIKKSMRNSEVEIPTFLYGSFYSNRAIVCNFLIRISPFSAQHYELQSQKFDTADRLFYSIIDSYKSLSTCQSDFKELIPQFYYFPQFLKNRCAYNLGSRQNKDIVHNVDLPKWASDEYEFIFRMRKCLECELVTVSLNHWIDLIFGVYANKKYAIKADNLFLGDLYQQGYERYLFEKDKTSIQLFKEFGQVPVPIINQNHIASKFRGNFIDSILHPSMRIQEFVPLKINEIGKVLQIFYYKRFTFLVFQKQIRMYEEQRFDKDFTYVNGEFQGGLMQFWQLFDSENKKHYCLIVHKKKTNEIIGYQIKKNLFNKYSIEGGDVFPFKHKCSLFCIYENFIFCVEDKNIYVYKNIQGQIDEEYSTNNFSLICNIGKNKYLLSVFSQFTHHKSRIFFIKSTERGIVVSIDEQNKCFITQISSNKVNIFNLFEIRSTYFEERLIELHLHNMGFLIIRTDYDRLLVYSFMGDNILTKHLNFEKNTNLSTEKPLTISIWNQELSEVVIGTNLGNLWKIDIFELRRLQKIKDNGGIWVEKLYLNKSGFRKEGLLKSAVNRIGRHSSTLIYAENNKIYTIKSQKWQEAKKVEILGKKIANFW